MARGATPSTNGKRRTRRADAALGMLPCWVRLSCRCRLAAAGTARAFAFTAGAAVRAVGLELVEAQAAAVVFVEVLEDLFGFGGVFLRPRAGFELVEADGSVAVRVEFLENLFGAGAIRCAGGGGRAYLQRMRAYWRSRAR